MKKLIFLLSIIACSSVYAQVASRLILTQVPPQGHALNVVYVNDSAGLNRLLNCKLDSVRLNMPCITGLDSALATKLTQSQANGLYLPASLSITGTMVTNWNTAYGWGDHAGLYRPIGYVPSWSEITSKPSFTSVATSGSYNDLTDKPSLFSGAFTDLSSKPTTLSGYGITDPVVLTSGSYSNPTWITSLAQNKVSWTGTTADFVMGNGAISAFPTIPTNTNQLTNGAGFITSADISGKENKADSGITHITPTGLSEYVSAVLPYTAYHAVVTQTGTSAPTAERKDNNFSGTNFTWARTGIGTYTLTASNPVFVSGKTVVIMSQETNGLNSYVATVSSTTVITFSTFVQSVISLVLSLTGQDALLTNTLVEVRVYN